MTEKPKKPYLYICPDPWCEHNRKALPCRFRPGQKVTSHERPGEVGTFTAPLCPTCEKEMELLVDSMSTP